jgi:phosphatidate cytidylyltransferase
MSNLARRVVVAVVGIPVIILLCMAGGFFFFAFVAIISSLALYEFYTLTESKGARPHIVPGLLTGLLVVGAFVYRRASLLIVDLLDQQGIAIPAPSGTQFFLIILLLAVVVTLILELFRDRGSAIVNLSTTVFGWMYVSLFFGALVGLREAFNPGDFPVSRYFQVVGPSVPEGIRSTIDWWGGATVVAVLFSIWVCDSTAYFVGRAFGKHPLFGRVSPKKTWEGALAGFVGAVVAFTAARCVALPYLSVFDAIVCGVIIGAFGQLGDLVESLLKRSAGVKDSSGLIPGHGGVLDRFDSLLFVSPLLFLYFEFIVFFV